MSLNLLKLGTFVPRKIQAFLPNFLVRKFLRKRIVSTDFRVNCPKICRNGPFTENFLTREAYILRGVMSLAGDHYLYKHDPGEKRISVAQYVVYDECKTDPYNFDIALLVLDSPAVLSTKVAPMNLTNIPPTENLHCLVAGEFLH